MVVMVLTRVCGVECRQKGCELLLEPGRAMGRRFGMDDNESAAMYSETKQGLEMQTGRHASRWEEA